MSRRLRLSSTTSPVLHCTAKALESVILMTEGSLGSARSGVRLTYSGGEAYELFAPVTHRPAFTNARYRVGSLTVVACVEACMANFRIVGNAEVIWELSALRFAVQKRASGGELPETTSGQRLLNVCSWAYLP